MPTVATCAPLHLRPPAWRPSSPARTFASPNYRCEQAPSVHPLTAYIDQAGDRRELVALPGHGGSTLVLDRDAATLGDRRLVAHMAADEPPENAALVCRLYLQDSRGRWCRRVQPEDLLADPLTDCHNRAPGVDRPGEVSDLMDPAGDFYRLGLLPGRSAAQLRWFRRQPGTGAVYEKVALRDVIAAFESYEPIRTLTEHAIERHSDDPVLGVTRLRSEFERLSNSPVVLNRGLREAVLDAIDRRGLSMSEIAIRCGVLKRGRRGTSSGETSWVARRIGIMPEGGEKTITPWVHTDVLAVIARKGLGVSPREVELQ